MLQPVDVDRRTRGRGEARRAGGAQRRRSVCQSRRGRVVWTPSDREHGGVPRAQEPGEERLGIGRDELPAPCLNDREDVAAHRGRLGERVEGEVGRRARDQGPGVPEEADAGDTRTVGAQLVRDARDDDVEAAYERRHAEDRLVVVVVPPQQSGRVDAEADGAGSRGLLESHGPPESLDEAARVCEEVLRAEAPERRPQDAALVVLVVSRRERDGIEPQTFGALELRRAPPQVHRNVHVAVDDEHRLLDGARADEGAPERVEVDLVDAQRDALLVGRRAPRRERPAAAARLERRARNRAICLVETVHFGG
mmetsp:Transcript_18379/g.73432  ORF Transcript_18379/g.73432 Transcript_18379/m.73432 type:complete len:310 (-) Transcript_18379:528-1457(-)